MLSQNALMSQSWTDGRGETNLDGWGISRYEGDFPKLQKNHVPAYRDELFSEAVEQIYSHTVIAHIRQATVGNYSVENTHPFTYHRWSFAHNGTLRDFQNLEPELVREVDPDLREQRRGQTDSELIFLWLLTRMRRIDGQGEYPQPRLSHMMDLLRNSLIELDRRSGNGASTKRSELNFLLTDGHLLFATRFGIDLFVQQQSAPRQCDICGRDHLLGEAPPDLKSVTIASEPVNERPWLALPPRSVTGIDEDLALRHLTV
jgi:glutamine amidotransferase